MLDPIAPVLSGEEPWTVVCGEVLEIVGSIDAVDAIVTDPPYARTGDAASIATTVRRSRIPKEDQFFEAWIANHLREWDRVLRPGGACWLTIDRRGTVDSACAKLGLSEPAVGVWVRGGLGMGFVVRHAHEHFCVVYKARFVRRATDEADVWAHDWCARSRRFGPAEKPVPLMARAVRLVSSPAEVVLDRFCGSGTTGVACLREGRRFIGIDRNPDCVAIARQRIGAEAQQQPLFADAAGR